MGIDACAHQSALSVHGKTVAVLGCGLDYTYPAQTAGLREQILRQGGTVLSELAPAVSVNGKIFSGSQSTHRGIVSGSFGGGSAGKKRCTHYSFLMLSNRARMCLQCRLEFMIETVREHWD